jgi:carbon monoxide dehydrogenase subunit G
MSRLSIRFHVAAAPEIVWDHVADPGQLPAWLTLAEKIADPSGSPGAVGSAFTAVQVVSGRRLTHRFVVRTSERPGRLEIAGTTEGGRTRVAANIESDGAAGSNVNVDIEYELSGTVLGSFLGRLTANVAEYEFRRSFDRLRALLDRPIEPQTRPPGRGSI